MKELQVRLLHARGWSKKSISQLLQVSTLLIDRVIEEAGESLPAVQDREMAVSELKDKEVAKQAELEPLYAVIEMGLIGKLQGAINSLDSADDKLADKISTLTKSYKLLTQDSIINKVVDDARLDKGLVVQILNTVN